MPRPRYFAPGQLQFITASTYRRAPLFLSPRFCREFVAGLQEVRSEFGFRMLGWVLMPDHFHLLIWPETAPSTSNIVKQLKQRTGARILKILRQNQSNRWCVEMLAYLRLPSTVHDHVGYRLWQRRFYPFGVYTEKKRLEKLDYMHGNPVKRGLAPSPAQWSRLAGSSFRFYHLGDDSVLRMDRLP
jgi:putative transposase